MDCNAGILAVPPTVPSLSTLSRQQDLRSIEAPLISPSSSNSNCESANHKSSFSPPAKKAKRKVNVHNMKTTRLPTLCPLLTMFTDDVAQAIADNKIKGIMTLTLERQAAAFYWGLCLWPMQHHQSMIQCPRLCVISILY